MGGIESGSPPAMTNIKSHMTNGKSNSSPSLLESLGGQLRLHRLGHDRIKAVSLARFGPFFLDEFLALLRQLHDLGADLPALSLAFLDLLFSFCGRKSAQFI